MAKARKDLKGRALWKGECQRASDKRYVYTYTDTYKYLYGYYAGDVLGKKKLTELRYADMVHFYFYLIEEKQLKVRTVEYIHIILHSVFEMAIKDEDYPAEPDTGDHGAGKEKNRVFKGNKSPSDSGTAETRFPRFPQ